MFYRFCVAAALFAALMLLPAAPASAQGEIVITQAKANAGNVTPGDAPGYPVILSQPGPYVLGSNLQVPAGQIGLRVQASNVDIDMNGFRLSGANGSGVAAAAYGLYSVFGESRIHDGVITQFRLDGILLAGDSNGWIVENMQITRNLRAGISAEASSYARYLHNTITVNGARGIWCGNSCHVEGSNVSANGGEGILIRSGTVLGNTIFLNTGIGVSDFFLPIDDTGIGNNTISKNNADSIQTLNTQPLHPNVCVPDTCS